MHDRHRRQGHHDDNVTCLVLHSRRARLRGIGDRPNLSHECVVHAAQGMDLELDSRIEERIDEKLLKDESDNLSLLSLIHI